MRPTPRRQRAGTGLLKVRGRELGVRIGELERQRRVETLARWRHPWDLSPDAARSRRVFERLKTLGSRFQQQFGGNFVGIQVFGSRAKGYATKKSDLEYRVIFKEAPPAKEDWSQVLAAVRAARGALAKERIRKDRITQSLVFLDDVTTRLEEHADVIADVFSGAWVSSPGKEKARQAIIEALDKSPFGLHAWNVASRQATRAVWERASHQAVKHAELKDFPGFVGVEDFLRIDASRLRMGLPSFEEMRRLYLRPRK